MTAPVASADGGYTISRTTDLKVTWTGGVEGTTTVAVTSGTTASGNVTISCSVAAASGALTVPIGMLASLGASGTFSAGVANVATKTVAGWQMSFQASSTRDLGSATFSD